MRTYFAEHSLESLNRIHDIYTYICEFVVRSFLWHCIVWHHHQMNGLSINVRWIEYHGCFVHCVSSETFDSIELRRCCLHCLPWIACVFSSNRNTHQHTHVRTHAIHLHRLMQTTTLAAFYFISFHSDSIRSIHLPYCFTFTKMRLREKERESQLFYACVNYYVLLHSMVFFTIPMSHAFSLTISSRIAYFLLNWSCTKRKWTPRATTKDRYKHASCKNRENAKKKTEVKYL